MMSSSRVTYYVGQNQRCDSFSRLPLIGFRRQSHSAGGPSSARFPSFRGRLVLASHQTTGRDVVSSTIPRQLLLASTTAGESEWLEVLEGEWDRQESEQSCVVGWKGQRLRLSQHGGNGNAVSVKQVGFYPETDGKLCEAFPELKEKLPECHSHAGDAAFRISHIEVADTLTDLSTAVASDPGRWNDGAVPGAGALPRLQLATETAGELLSLMQGSRGICAVQLWNGWDTSNQYLYSPFVLAVLEQALATAGLKAVLSLAPDDDNPVALSAILYVDKEPWNRWAPHLASFGFQDKLVGGSAYYKMLCGLMLGYKTENVKSYVINTSPSGALTPAVTAKVTADMKKLSKAKPKLPWNKAGGSRGKRNKGGK